ncbi:DUF4359 domain-containing protein [Tumidithrix elongata RA019]|uniref:DUF4359 domain-containing protein n=1 Tax=Tumidithrix elongata BACA0141 TaxID=2716417 RepID=A0AAW9Q5E4_9CYAN|nr:DUF4359 domain-containing protein [Tumidithrix elongata RA019]
MRRKLVAVLGVVGAIALVMVFTNPNKEKYIDYASVKMATDIQNQLCKPTENKNPKDLLGNIKNLAADLCKLGIDSQDALVKKLITPRTQQQNMVIFSIYTTEVPGRTYKTLAIFGNFIGLN